MIPNYNILSEYFFRYKRDIEIEEGPAPGLGEDRTAMLEQAGYIESKNKTVAYHFPVGNYFEELGKDQYFGTFFPETNTNSLYKGAVINSQQNVMFDQHYFDFLGEGGARSIEELLSGREYAINEKLSNFLMFKLSLIDILTLRPSPARRRPATLVLLGVPILFLITSRRQHLFIANSSSVI